MILLISGLPILIPHGSAITILIGMLLFQIFVKDVWKECAGWPLNDMERSYKFMVKHGQLWNVAFHSTSPRWIHGCYLAAMAAYYAKYVLLNIFCLLQNCGLLTAYSLFGNFIICLDIVIF